MLLEEVLMALIGHTGDVCVRQTIKQSNNQSNNHIRNQSTKQPQLVGVIVDPSLTFIDQSEHQSINQILKLSYYYICIQDFIDNINQGNNQLISRSKTQTIKQGGTANHQSNNQSLNRPIKQSNEPPDSRFVPSLYRTSFVKSLEPVLHAYQSTILSIDQSNNQTINLAQLTMTLQPFQVLFRSINQTIEQIESDSSLIGGKLLSTINQSISHGYPVIQSMYQSINHSINQSVFFHQIECWCVYGQLWDPYGEFFIMSSNNQPNKQSDNQPNNQSNNQLINCSFRIRHSMLPTFISPSIAQSILFIGQSINVMKAHEQTVKQSINQTNIQTNDQTTKQSINETGKQSGLLEPHSLTFVKQLNELSKQSNNLTIKQSIDELEQSIYQLYNQSVSQFTTLVIKQSKLFDCLNVLHSFFFCADSQFYYHFINNVQSINQTTTQSNNQAINLTEAQVQNAWTEALQSVNLFHSFDGASKQMNTQSNNQSDNPAFDYSILPTVRVEQPTFSFERFRKHQTIYRSLIDDSLGYNQSVDQSISQSVSHSSIQSTNQSNNRLRRDEGFLTLCGDAHLITFEQSNNQSNNQSNKQSISQSEAQSIALTDQGSNQAGSLFTTRPRLIENGFETTISFTSQWNQTIKQSSTPSINQSSAVTTSPSINQSKHGFAFVASTSPLPVLYDYHQTGHTFRVNHSNNSTINHSSNQTISPSNTRSINQSPSLVIEFLYHSSITDSMNNQLVNQPNSQSVKQGTEQIVIYSVNQAGEAKCLATINNQSNNQTLNRWQLFDGRSHKITVKYAPSNNLSINPSSFTQSINQPSSLSNNQLSIHVDNLIRPLIDCSISQTIGQSVDRGRAHIGWAAATPSHNQFNQSAPQNNQTMSRIVIHSWSFNESNTVSNNQTSNQSNNQSNNQWYDRIHYQSNWPSLFSVSQSINQSVKESSLFSFLFRVRVAFDAMRSCSVNMMKHFRSINQSNNQSINQNMILRSQMHHFLQSLNDHLFIDIIHAQHAKFMQSVKQSNNESQSYLFIQSCFNQYLNNLMHCCHRYDRVINSLIDRLIDCCQQFVANQSINPTNNHTDNQSIHQTFNQSLMLLYQVLTRKSDQSNNQSINQSINQFLCRLDFNHFLLRMDVRERSKSILGRRATFGGFNQTINPTVTQATTQSINQITTQSNNQSNNQSITQSNNQALAAALRANSVPIRRASLT